MKTELYGKVAMISGGGQGIGLAIAEVFAEEGANISICSRNAETLAQAASRIEREAGVQCLAVSADLATPEGVDTWKTATMAKFGRVDTLVNNASATRGGHFLDLTPEIWEEALALKMHGYINMAHAVLPIMLEQKSGSIINIVGVTGSQPAVPGGIIGAVAGAALINFTKALALEFAHLGIRVNAVSPGATATYRRVAILESLRRSGMSEIEAERESVREVPLGRAAHPREIANVVVFLASNLASYVTGENVNVDGGYVRGI